MVKGFRFKNQLANAEVDARIHQKILNNIDGIFYGMELNQTSNSITVSEGLCEVAGRPIAVVGSETVNIATEVAYCVLVVEIDLSKETTINNFEQAQIKVLTSTTDYPSSTKQDINIYNGENTLYQYELARFKTSSNGITDFQDTRTFLDFHNIYNSIQTEYRKVLTDLKNELASVTNGSAYILKDNFVVIEGSLEIPTNQFGTKIIDFPNGFNYENSIVISNGISVIGGKGFNYVGDYKDTSDMMNNSLYRRINVTYNGINIDIKNPDPTEYMIVHYKIVLMKIP